MNDFSRRTGAENLPVMRNLVGKGSSQVTSKGRAFGDVGNVNKVSVTFNSKSAAIERQRANAEKLSKGYSVVHSKANAENENIKEKPRAPLRVIAKENVSIPSRVSTAAVKPIFRVPAKPLKQKKPSTQIIQKSTSVTSLHGAIPETTRLVNELPIDISALIVDDDKKYEKDEFLLGLYAKDIYQYLRNLEKQQLVRNSYLTNQHIMTEGMRAVLVDWMFEVQQSFDLLQDTAQMAVGLLDRFLQDTPRVPKEDLQLVGVTCIFIAAKYEEMYPPGVGELVQVSADACSKLQILRMEQRIFRSLNFSIGRPPPIQFLRRYCRVAQVTSLIYTLSKYFVDLALVQYKFCHLPPSLLASAALYLALFVKKEPATDETIWTPTLIFFTEYTLKDLKPILPRLAKLVVQASKLKQQSVQLIYGNQKKQFSVSARPELTSERMLALARSDS